MKTTSKTPSPQNLIRDILSLDPPVSPDSSEDDDAEAHYAVLLLSTDHDLSYVVRTLKKRRYAPPSCVGVVLQSIPGLGAAENGNGVGPGMLPGRRT